MEPSSRGVRRHHAIVGCSDALEIPNLSTVTGSCAEGDIGYVYTGEVPFEVEEGVFR